jgi:hypothetical protein
VKNCHGLLFFLFYMLLFVVILSLQMGIGLGANKLYATLTDNIFSTDVVQDGNGGIADSLGGGYADLYTTWYEEAILAQVFVPPACGDGICEAPDEYPEFSASDDARSFLGCKADCGTVATEPVRPAWWWVLCVFSSGRRRVVAYIVFLSCARHHHRVYRSAAHAFAMSHSTLQVTDNAWYRPPLIVAGYDRLL